MDIDKLKQQASALLETVLGWLASPQAVRGARLRRATSGGLRGWPRFCARRPIWRRGDGCCWSMTIRARSGGWPRRG